MPQYRCDITSGIPVCKATACASCTVNQYCNPVTLMCVSIRCTAATCTGTNNYCDPVTFVCRASTCNDPGFECPYNLLCVRNMCVYNPNSNCIPGILQCPSGQVCDQYRCRTATCLDPGYACQAPQVCDPVTKQCETVQVRGCIETGCPYPQKCFNNVCTDDNSSPIRCRTETDCARN